MKPIREEEDPFSVLDENAPGTAFSEESWRIARRLSIVVGPEAPVIDRYLRVLANAPPEHLRLLQRRDARIVFAPTIPHALTAEPATIRRGRELTSHERLTLRSRYSPESHVAGIYDPDLDLLIFPTHYIARDLERVVLHELGHALTMHRAQGRPALLKGLPRAIARHIRERHYGPDSDPDTLRRRVLEVLAEGYAYLVVGQAHLLPGAVVSELMFILRTVEDDAHIRFEFDDETDRTSTRITDSRLVFPDDPELGHLLAPRPSDAEVLEAHDLDEDELAARRLRRRAA